MTVINASDVQVCAAADIPGRWAEALAKKIIPNIAQTDCDMLEERIVSLGHGVDLAHLRTELVSAPTLGAYKCREVEGSDRPWLCILVFIPKHNASRHLGWMAHLASGLHDEENRQYV